MRLILLTILTMIAFASNSILNRVAVDSGSVDPASFALIRTLSGALVLSALLMLQSRPMGVRRPGRAVGVISLTVYMIGFSLAYITLDAGLGALILFGTVQVTMFGWGALTGTRATVRQVGGASIAFAGLVLALWPAEGTGGDLVGALLMVLAGVGWAAYTLAGRGEADPLATTAANFTLCFPVLLILLFWAVSDVTWLGAALAVICGGITSGLGYALWYHVLPQIEAQTAAVVQLSVPVIAILAGAGLLGEALGWDILLAATLVLGGIAVTITAPKAQAGHS